MEYEDDYPIKKGTRVRDKRTGKVCRVVDYAEARRVLVKPVILRERTVYFYDGLEVAGPYVIVTEDGEIVGATFDNLSILDK